MNKFNVGDVVSLKSGGPKMTVSDAELTDRVTCRYFNEVKGEFILKPFNNVELVSANA